MYIGSWYFDDVPSFGESEGYCFSIGLGRTLILRLHDQRDLNVDLGARFNLTYTGEISVSLCCLFVCLFLLILFFF